MREGDVICVALQARLIAQEEDWPDDDEDFEETEVEGTDTAESDVEASRSSNADKAPNAEAESHTEDTAEVDEVPSFPIPYKANWEIFKDWNEEKWEEFEDKEGNDEKEEEPADSTNSLEDYASAVEAADEVLRNSYTKVPYSSGAEVQIPHHH